MGVGKQQEAWDQRSFGGLAALEGAGLLTVRSEKGAASALGCGKVIAEALEGSGGQEAQGGGKGSRVCFLAFFSRF